MPARVSTYISNHASWTDIPTMLHHFKIAFVSKVEVASVPMLGIMTAAIGCIFVTRDASDNERNAVVKSIIDRQKQIEESDDYNPIVIFAEGGTSNGQYLLTFKRGAF